VSTNFVDYVKHGWKLCKIEPGTKGPRSAGWNNEANTITIPAVAERLVGAGLCHAYSGTCAIDVDRYDEAEKFLQEHGIDLSVLFSAPDAVQISSGRTNRGKLIYKIDAPLITIQPAGGAVEFRCTARTGNTVQDVLPPTIHPDTQQPYKWVGDWKQLPTLPEPLKALWLLLLEGEKREPIVKSAGADHAELVDLLSRRNPNCGYEDWIKVGMALHHETEGSQDGLAIWDEWSAPSDKYPGLDNLRSHWSSFGSSAVPITVDSLRKADVASVEGFDDVSNQSDWLEGPEAERPKPLEFNFLSLGDLFQRPEPSWLIKGILPDSGLGAFYGQPGGGKTFLAIDVALTVALGNSWRGLPVVQGPSLYIAAEDDRGVQMRFLSGLAARGVTWEQAPIKVLPGTPVFTSPKHQEALLKGIRAHGRQSLVFIDTLAAVTPGTDENAGKDMGQVLYFCQRIQKATGGLVMLIHHEGKTTGRGPRGWSGLHGAFDVEWEVSNEETHHEMKITKMKNAPTGNSYSFKRIPVGESCVIEWI
jgi:hypothetical protein